MIRLVAVRLSLAVSVALSLLLSLPAATAGEPLTKDPPGKARSLEELLELVRQGRAAEARDNQAREQRFLHDRDVQRKLLAEAEAARAAEEKRSTALEAAFAANDQRLAALQKDLDAQIGSMKELFGVLQYAAIDARRRLDQSIISAELPNRGARLASLAETTASAARLPSIADIETLWYETLREMAESGKASTFKADIMQPDGSRTAREVLRIGSFALTSGRDFIRYVPETGTLERLSRQPSDPLRTAAAAFAASRPGSVAAYPIDPTGGELLERLVQQPSFRERVDHGGFIGYLIIGLGLFSLILIAERIFYLAHAGRKLRAQMRSDVISTDNPLGRVLAVYQDNPTVDVETLEFKLDEAIVRETPAFERSTTLIRVISLAAPLFGLLGTAIGMIQTFQALTLFGSGDAKILAAGIAQALVPTVLGLVVAIPTLFAHNIIASMSRRIVQILREQSAGIVAVHAEREHK